MDYTLSSDMNNHVVIMAGGIGSRFWPLSTPEYPKQFIDILGCGRSLIQLTVDRFKGICPMSNFWIVTNAKYIDIVEKQIPGIQRDHILAEPEARNTAPCIAWACWRIMEEDAGANIVVTPSDAVVIDTDEFRRVIKESLSYAGHSETIVTIGIEPCRPETGYGYIQFADRVCGSIHRVEMFREKPDIETAKAYLEDGHFLWNAGIFVWNIQTIYRAICKYSPQIAGIMDRIAKSFDTAAEKSTIKELFPLCEKISIDYAVMEPASKDGLVCVRPSDVGWSDLGNWASLYDKMSKDQDGNGVVGNASLFDCNNCIVHVEDARKVILQGLDGYIISGKNGCFIVCKRTEEQRIKEFSSE